MPRSCHKPRTRLEAMRRRRGLTQQQLAVLADVSRYTISLAEAGETRLRRSTRRLLAEALHCTPDELKDKRPR